MVISVHGFSVILGIFMVKILSLQVSLAFSICILPSIFRYHPEIFIWGMLCYAMLCQVTSVVSDSVRPHRRQPTRLPRPWDSPGKNTGVGLGRYYMNVKVRLQQLTVYYLLSRHYTINHIHNMTEASNIPSLQI